MPGKNTSALALLGLAALAFAARARGGLAGGVGGGGGGGEEATPLSLTDDQRVLRSQNTASPFDATGQNEYGFVNRYGGFTPFTGSGGRAFDHSVIFTERGPSGPVERFDPSLSSLYTTSLARRQPSTVYDPSAPGGRRSTSVTGPQVASRAQPSEPMVGPASAGTLNTDFNRRNRSSSSRSSSRSSSAPSTPTTSTATRSQVKSTRAALSGEKVKSATSVRVIDPRPGSKDHRRLQEKTKGYRGGIGF